MPGDDLRPSGAEPGALAGRLAPGGPGCHSDLTQGPPVGSSGTASPAPPCGPGPINCRGLSDFSEWR